MYSSFINRAREIDFLASSWKRPEAQLLVVYGRRRVGKTALLRRFSENLPGLHYVATRLPEAQQLAEMGRSLGAALDDPLLASTGFQGWDQLFAYLARLPRRVCLILDELPYLIEANQALSSLWQRAWDEQLAASRAFVVLCGSSVAMMERETLDVRSPLYGRRTGQLKLQPLDFSDARLFFPRYRFEDQVRAFAVAGGIPYYLRLLDDSVPLRRNIRERILGFGAPLREEVEFLVRQELREPRVYFGILSAMASGKHKPAEILNATGLTPSTVGKYITVLQRLGLVRREVPATETRPEKSKRGLYRIADPFVRFWFRFVLPQRGLLETGRIDEAAAVINRDLDHFTSAAYEEICRSAVARGLFDAATGSTWGRVGRWWSRTAELDLLAAAPGDSAVLFGEVKWSRRPVGTNVLARLEETAATVPIAHGARRSYTLFSRSGFTDALLRTSSSRPDLVLVHGLEVMQ